MNNEKFTFRASFHLICLGCRILCVGQIFIRPKSGRVLGLGSET